ncbi:hypothetical protein H7X87_00525 [Acetobacteraceae bacterium]|nr:hypothetical protein [Candidatus Parcubacteria bacterium]
MKRKVGDLSKEETIVTLDALYTAATAMKGRDAVKLFLRDLLTPSERIMLGRRIIVARLLIARVPYGEIEKRLRVSSTTIGRVHRWLKDQFPGFEQAIAGMEKEFESRNEKKLYATSALYRLKKKYPLHFLLVPVPKRKRRAYGEYPQ